MPDPVLTWSVFGAVYVGAFLWRAYRRGVLVGRAQEREEAAIVASRHPRAPFRPGAAATTAGVVAEAIRREHTITIPATGLSRARAVVLADLKSMGFPEREVVAAFSGLPDDDVKALKERVLNRILKG